MKNYSVITKLQIRLGFNLYYTPRLRLGCVIFPINSSSSFVNPLISITGTHVIKLGLYSTINYHSDLKEKCHHRIKSEIKNLQRNGQLDVLVEVATPH